MPRRASQSRSRWLWLLAVALFTAFLTSAQAQAQAITVASAALGGYPSFTEETIVELAQGQQLGPVNSLWVENSGDSDATVKFDSTAPAGISVQPQTRTAQLRPGENHTFVFSVAVNVGQLVGTYRIGVSATQQNPPRADTSAIVVAPQLTAHFNVRVVGATASVAVRATNAQDGSPVTGQLSLTYTSKPESTFPVASIKGSELTTALAPGRYTARFAVPGVVEKSESFSIEAGEQRTVTIAVNTVSFTSTELTEHREDDELATVTLGAAVNNFLTPIIGETAFAVDVSRDGNLVETVEFGSRPELALGAASAATLYRPVGGWQSGQYVFNYRLVTPNFTLAAEDSENLLVRPTQSWILLAGALATLAALGLAGTFVTRKRRRRSTCT